MNRITIKFFSCESREGEVLSSILSKCLKDLENELDYTFTFHSQPAKGLSKTSDSSAYQLC